MKKPMGYDEAQVSGEFVPVTPGGHYCVIKRVDEAISSNSAKPMIIVYFDFSGKDLQEGYFTKSYNDDVREDKTWPFAGRKYIMVEDYKDPNKTSRQFKTFCSTVENSNENFVVQWGDDWGEQFKGKQVGIIFGREEQEYDGKVTMRCLPKWFCKIDAVKDAKVPEDKLLKKPDPKPSAFEPLDDSDMPF